MTQNRVENYSSCCRLCLTDKFNLNNIYAGCSEGDGLAEKIQLLVGVQITSADKLSTSLCDNCVSTINNWDGYKKECLSNQTKLQQWMENSNEPGNSVVQIKDEPVDADDPNDVVALDDELQVQIVKPEPVDTDDLMELEYFDMPPPLTPNNIEITVENGVDDNVMPTNLECQIGNFPDVSVTVKDSKSCKMCKKVFSSPASRRLHERTMHGPSRYIPVNQRYQSSRFAESVTEPETIIDEEMGSQGSSQSEKDQDKIEFAAGLRLQSTGNIPKPPASLTIIEQNYLEKCRIMISMFDRQTCCCHNVYYPSFKKMLAHLRTLYAWFAPYTCYNCLIRHEGRSGQMRHNARCPRVDYENLIRLSELRARCDDKFRLYQTFKCIQCDYLFWFYEDFCDHVDSEHVPEESPFVCVCENVFENADAYRRHIHKAPCFLNYHCDICFLLTPDLAEFVTHCEENHDNDEDFVFLNLDAHFKVLSNIQIANKLLESQERLKAREIEEHGDTSMEEPEPQTRSSPLNIKRMISAYNPQAGKYIPTKCTHCSKVYSSYHNMLRHLKSAHNIDTIPKNPKNECDICGNDFSSYHNMLRHRKLHEEEGTLKCPDCPQKFRLNAQLKDHFAQVHGEKDGRTAFRCEDCGQSFRNPKLLEYHMDQPHCYYKCEECNQDFTTAKDLQQHMETAHPGLEQGEGSGGGNNMCHICDKTFHTDEELDEHYRMHNEMPNLVEEDGELKDVDVKPLKTFDCQDCDKVYGSARGLWVHNKRYHPHRVITREFPKDCHMCDRTISTLAAWLMHKAMHDREAARAQGLPVTSFKYKSVAKENPPDTQGDDSDESYHTCKRCFKVFASKYNLKNHMKCHGIAAGPISRNCTKTGKPIKTYWCDICHASCQGLAELNKHKIEHINEDPDMANQQEMKNNYKQVYCKYCKVPFNSLDVLNQHMAEEHDEDIKPVIKEIVKKFACDICKKVFATNAALSTHYGWHKRSKTEKIFEMAQRNIKRENPYKCNTCPATYERDSDLQLHILREHRNITTKTRCSICRLEFKTMAECEAHEKLHYKQNAKTGVLCKHCGKVFSRTDYLTIHISKKHPEHAVIGTYKCSHCDRVFEKQNALTIHLKVHEKAVSTPPQSSSPAPSGARVYKYSCSICNFGFDLPKELRAHIIAKHPF